MKKSLFEDERIPQNVKDALLRWKETLKARGSDLKEGEQQGMQIWLNPPPSWRPKKKDKQEK